jgi:hypothetical protein
MSLAFTSDAKNRWAAEWLTWPDFATFWAQTVRHVMRKAEAKGVYVEVERRGQRTEVRLDAVDANGRYRNQAETTLTVIGPDIAAEKKQLPMRQVAPGRYVADFETAREGSYHLDLAQTAGSQLAFRQSRGLVVGYPDELRLRPPNETLLKRVAEVSGGKFAPTPEAILDIGDQTAASAQPLWPYLLAAGLLLFLVDVAFRRIDLSLIFVGTRR